MESLFLCGCCSEEEAVAAVTGLLMMTAMTTAITGTEDPEVEGAFLVAEALQVEAVLQVAVAPQEAAAMAAVEVMVAAPPEAGNKEIINLIT